MRKRHLLTLGTVLTAAMTLSACSSGAPAAENPETTTPGLDKVTLGVIESVAMLPYALGQEQGIYEKHGIELELQPFAGGAAMVPAVLEGGTHIGDGNLLSVMMGVEKGLDLQLLVPSFEVTADSAADMSAIVVAKGSDITSPADLDGKTVAVNALASISQVAVVGALEAAGLDADAVNFVEMPFPQIPQAVEEGNVDAGFVVTPFPQLNADSLEIISYPYSELFTGEAVGGFFANTKWLDDNSDLAARFIAAFQESSEYVNTHEDEARALLPELLGLPEAVVSAMPIPTFGGDPVETPKIVDIALELGMLQAAPDYTTLYWNGE